MTALTISAVDNTTDTLTSVAHGLVTGDGPAAIRNIGGALPAGLAAVTDYWVIRTGADTFKLATSSANALLGTAINITTNGTGTQILEIGIPYRRATTYVPNSGPPGSPTPGSQIKSADLNAMEDALKAIHALFTDQAQSMWTGIARGARQRKISAVAGQSSGGAFSFVNHWWASTATGDKIEIPIVVESGERITKIEVLIFSDTVQTVSAQLIKNLTGSAGAALGDAAASTAHTNQAQTLTINTQGGGAAPLDETVADDLTSYSVLCTVTGAVGEFGIRIPTVVVTTTRPTV